MSVAKLVKYLNKNVYFTNLLLIPSLITSITIYNDSVHISGKHEGIQDELYTYFWLFLTCYIVIVILASTIYHLFMFSDIREKYPRILKIDLITAPIFGLILLGLTILYGRFLLGKCFESENKYPQMYISSVIFMSVGLLIWIFKRIFMKGWKEKGLLYKIKYLEAHTFFHYISYTGVMMMLFLIMFENKLIYETLFTDLCDK